MKSIAAIPPNTPPERSDTPNTPSAAKYGVPEPTASSLFAISTLSLDVPFLGIFPYLEHRIVQMLVVQM